MTDAVQASDRRILMFATEYAALVAKYRGADHHTQQALRIHMADLLKTCGLELEAEKCLRREKIASHIRCFVRDRKPFNCAIDAAEAEAVRLCYATPPARTLDLLSGEDLISLADHFEGWSQDARLDQRAMIELLGWSDGMRLLAHAVGGDYAPLPPAEGAKVPLLKFIANKTRAIREK